MLHLKYVFTLVLWVRHRVVWHVVLTSDRAGWFPPSSRLCGSLPAWRRKNWIGLKSHGHHFSLKESDVSQWTWLIFLTLSILILWCRLSISKPSTTVICLFLSSVHLRMETESSVWKFMGLIAWSTGQCPEYSRVYQIKKKNSLKYHTKCVCLEFVCMAQYSYVHFHSTFWYVICILLCATGRNTISYVL